jgi:hypothetical protein
LPFFVLPAWSAYLLGAFTRDYSVNPGQTVAAIVLAPIIETTIFSVPILEICRKLKVILLGPYFVLRHFLSHSTLSEGFSVT